MNNDFLRSIIAGIVGTIAMTALTMLGIQFGMPKMEPPIMLANAMGIPVAIGWVMHFGIGITLAVMYTLFFKKFLGKISSNLLKGIIFGVIAIILAQIGLGVLGAIFPMEEPVGSEAMKMLSILSGHILFGIVTVLIIEKNSKA